MIKKSKFKSWKGFMQEPKGHIAIQHHGEEVWYRNIRVRGKCLLRESERGFTNVA